MGCGGSHEPHTIPGVPNNKLNHDEQQRSPPTRVGDNRLEASNYEDHEVGDLSYIQTDGLVDYMEFPTPLLLREANNDYYAVNKRSLPERDSDGKWLPYPTPSTKKEVFSVELYQHIDDHALKAPNTLLEGTLAELVTYLCRPAKDDMGKVRAIFRWLTGQDINSFKGNEKAGEDSPLSRLLQLKNYESYYAEVFVEICRAAGFDAETISGIVKASEFVTGEEVSEETEDIWAAVLVDKTWRLFDPSWSSSQIRGGSFGQWKIIDEDGEGAVEFEEEKEQLVHNYDETWFAVDPELMIYTHYPKEDEQWQLLARPLTRREFNEVVDLKPAFLDLDLQLVSHKKCVIHAPVGEVDIEIGLPAKRRNFIYRLWMSTEGNKGRKGEMKNFQLDRFVFMQQQENALIASLYFPTEGKFKLDLFSCKDQITEDPDIRMVCSYVIYSGKPQDEIQPFPENERKEWGPGEDLENAGLHAISHKGAIVESEDGTAQIRFKADRDVALTHALNSNTKSMDDLDNYVIHYTEDDDIVLRVKMPDPGDYALNLYAKDVEAEGELPNVCSYLLTTSLPAFDAAPFPAVYNGFAGVTPAGKVLGAQCTSHKSAFIEAPDVGEIDVDLKLAMPCLVSAELNFQGDENSINRDQYMLCTKDHDNKTHMKIRLSDSGMYSLQVYAANLKEDGDLANIYNFIIKNSIPMENCTPFPKAFEPFQNRHCKVSSPLAGTLPCNQSLAFAVEIQDAKEVAVISGSNWTMLKKDAGNVWKGVAKTGAPESEFMLVGKLLGSSENFETLLKYEIAHPEEITKQSEAQESLRQRALEKLEKEKKRKQNRENDLKATRKTLQQAISDRDSNVLQVTLKHIKSKRYMTPLKKEVAEAMDLLLSLERIERLQHAVLDMDAATVLEIHRYANPPKLVHEIMVAALLLLGDHEGKTRTWKQCQKLCNTIGPQGLPRRIKDFDVQKLSPEIAARARLLISQYRLDAAAEKSAGAGTFYSWILGMTEELRKLKPGSEMAPPAGLARQKEILNH